MSLPLRALAFLALAPVLAACFSGAGGDSPRPGCAAGTTPPAAWAIDLTHGLTLVDRPFASKPATGLAGHLGLAGRDQGPDPDPTLAVVTLAGAAVPLRSGSFEFGLMAARPAGVEPGGTVRVVATLGNECTSLEVTCPSFDIASPAEGAAAAPGGTVTVTWHGTIHHAAILFGPAAGIDTYSASANERSGSLFYPVVAGIPTGDTSVSLPVPADTQGGYVVELGVPGPMVFDPATSDAGICLVARRVHLTAAP